MQTTNYFMYYVYILQNKKEQNYIGHTQNLEERLRRYNSGREKYIKNKGPFEIIYKEGYDTRGKAMAREKELKQGQGRKWIKDNILKK